MNDAILCGRGRQYRKLQCVQRVAAVAVGNGRDTQQRVALHFDRLFSKTALLVRERRGERREDIFRCQRVKLEHAAARHDGRGHRDHRVLRRRADKTHGPLFKRGQQAVALRLAPAVALVEQKIGRLPCQRKPLCRSVQDLAQFLDAGTDRVELLKRRARARCDDGSERRFPRTRRAEKNRRLQPVGQDRAAQELSLAHDMLLPHKFVERARPHPIRKRRTVFHIRPKQRFFHTISLGFP